MSIISGISLDPPLPPKTGPSTGMMKVRKATGINCAMRGLQHVHLMAIKHDERAAVRGTKIAVNNADHHQYIQWYA